jgi:hypothetical protein
MREAASWQGATGAWLNGPTVRPSGRGPAGKGGERLVEKKNMGHGWAESDEKINF